MGTVTKIKQKVTGQNMKAGEKHDNNLASFPRHDSDISLLQALPLILRVVKESEVVLVSVDILLIFSLTGYSP